MRIVEENFLINVYLYSSIILKIWKSTHLQSLSQKKKKKKKKKKISWSNVEGWPRHEIDLYTSVLGEQKIIYKQAEHIHLHNATLTGHVGATIEKILQSAFSVAKSIKLTWKITRLNHLFCSEIGCRHWKHQSSQHVKSSHEEVALMSIMCTQTLNCTFTLSPTHYCKC